LACPNCASPVGLGDGYCPVCHITLYCPHCRTQVSALDLEQCYCHACGYPYPPPQVQPPPPITEKNIGCCGSIAIIVLALLVISVIGKSCNSWGAEAHNSPPSIQVTTGN
jgi:hypothetical protein